MIPFDDSPIKERYAVKSILAISLVNLKMHISWFVFFLTTHLDQYEQTCCWDVWADQQCNLPASPPGSDWVGKPHSIQTGILNISHVEFASENKSFSWKQTILRFPARTHYWFNIGATINWLIWCWTQVILTLHADWDDSTFHSHRLETYLNNCFA